MTARTSPAPDPVVRAAGASRSFGSVEVLHGIDMVVDRGVIVGLIGPSGCGKTTLIRVLTGIAPATSGEVLVLGEDPASFSTRTRMRIGYLPQAPVLYPQLSLWANLTFVASVYGVPLRHRRARLREVLDFVDLGRDRGKRLADCSGGMQRRLSLAATLVHQPEVLFLDEPTAGIDPVLRDRFWERFRSLRDGGHTLVVSTQYVGESAMCDVVAVLVEGRILVVDTPDGLRRRAFGGDVVHLVTASGWVSPAELRAITGLAWVVAAAPHEGGARVVLSSIDAAPELTAHCERSGMVVASVDTVQPSFDEAFVALMRQADASDPVPA